MNGPNFLDTNILVYSYDSSDARKRAIAQGIVARALAGDGVVSTQVLSEFAVTLLHKLSPPARPKDVAEILDSLSSVRVIGVDYGVVRRAVEARAAYGIHFYDGMIVAAAEREGCGRILSEDLTAGQSYFQIPVENPFA
ncbi:MAG: PIN domain-containing protein [Candidatus Acidiferrum sp.]